MPKLRVLGSTEVIKALQTFGFEVTGQNSKIHNFTEANFNYSK